MKKNAAKEILRKLINPFNIYKAWKYAKTQKTRSRTEEDPQLQFYSDVLQTDMLHYGYFKEKDISWIDISLRDMENAQIAYAEKIRNLISKEAESILDAGAGMGGLGNLLQEYGCFVTCLTPDKSQAEYIRRNHPSLDIIESKYEDLLEEKAYTTIIHSESLQYIPLGTAFKKTEELIDPQGEWIVSDYFRLAEYRNSKLKSGHVFEEFKGLAEQNNWKISYMEDITDNVLPTLSYAYNFGYRLLKPVLDFSDVKLKHKAPLLRYYLNDIFNYADVKLEKEISGLNPENFAREKRYLLLKLTKK